MGAWGTKLYQDDDALDIKEIYKSEIKKGISNKEVTEKLISMFKSTIEDEEEGAPIFWCVLADLQWDLGKLLPEVREKALYYIEKGGDLNLWGAEESKEYKARKKVLDELYEKLHSSQPPEKIIKVRKGWKCDWKIGDVFAYKLNQEYSKNTSYFNKYVVFVKVSEYKNYLNDIESIIQVYDELFNQIPKIEDLKSIKYLNVSEYKDEDNTYSILSSRRSRSYKKEKLIYIGNKKTKINKKIKIIYANLISWKFFDFDLIINFYKYSTNKGIVKETDVDIVLDLIRSKKK